MRVHWMCLGVALGVMSCKKTVEAPPAPKEAPAAAPPPAPAPASAPKVATATVTPVILSLFEPVGDRCEWWQLRPVSKAKKVVASFPGSCRGARWAMDPAFTKALVWFDPRTIQQAGSFSQNASPAAYPDEREDDAPNPRLYAVDLKGGAAHPVGLPTLRGELRELGVDAQGRFLAMSEEAIEEAVAASGRVMVDGSTISIPAFDEGGPGLVHGYRFEQQKWQRVESKVVSTGWDYGEGVEALALYAQLGPLSAARLDAHAKGESASPAEQQTLAAFRPAKASADDGEWLRLQAPTPVYVWQISAEFVFNTGLLVFGGSSWARAPDLGFTDGELVAVTAQGPYLLVASQGAGTHPRLYDATLRRLVFKSDTARAATFWPEAPKADTSGPAPSGP